MRGICGSAMAVGTLVVFSAAQVSAVGAQRCDRSLSGQFAEVSARFDWAGVRHAPEQRVDDGRPDEPLRAAVARLHPFAVACLRSIVRESDENTTVAVARDLISRRRDEVFLRLADGALSWSEANRLMAQIAVDERRIGLRIR